VSGSPTSPIVSVVMAAYNGAGLIEETLASLAAQTLADFEVLVVDDRSTDATRDIVRAWPDDRVRLIALEVNGGPVRARNRGVAEARGRYIAGLDQDDLCRPERFARQVAWLDAHADCALLGTQVDWLDGTRTGPSRYPAVTTPALIAWLTWIENPLAWSSVMVRADVARRLDPFTRPEILYAEDFDLYHRVQAHGGIARLDEALVVYRRHGGGASNRFTETMEDSATRVLAQAHAAILGEAAAAALARLLVVHLMRGDPVPDRATLAALGAGMATLQAAFLARHDPAADSRLIRWETARRWAGIGRAGLRAGTLTLADLAAVRPADFGLGHAGVDDLLLSRLVGWTRTLRRAG
jgi:GT2 family glycosyltransferase